MASTGGRGHGGKRINSGRKRTFKNTETEKEISRIFELSLVELYFIYVIKQKMMMNKISPNIAVQRLRTLSTHYTLERKEYW